MARSSKIWRRMKCAMTSRTNRINSTPKQRPKPSPNPHGVEERRHQTMAQYLAGDKIEDICREMGCSKSWLYKWRNRYRADDPTWAQERTRRPRSNPRQLPERIEEAIVHLARTVEPRRTGRVSATAIGQALKDQAMKPFPSQRTIYRVLQRHDKEANRPISRPSESHMEAL
ncbi:MAG: helix-turn-helix domain-containing protein [Candidatus Binatia bacterium]